MTRRAHPEPSGGGNGHPQDRPYVRDWYERRAASGFGDVEIGRDTGSGERVPSENQLRVGRLLLLRSASGL